MADRERKLTAKQERFVEEYLKDLNATQAAIRAGYSERNASRIAAQLLGKYQVAQAIAERKAQRSEETGIDARLVLTRLAEFLDADPADILDEEGNVKPITDWPITWRRMLNGFDVQELFAGRGEDREQIGVLKKLKWLDRIKVIELLGKHVDVSAFKENIEHSGKVDIAARITEARRRKQGSGEQ